MAVDILLAVGGCIMLWLNVRATLAISRDTFSEPTQRSIQFAFVWALPFIGSIVVLAVHRQDEAPSRKYLERKGPEDELTGVDVVEAPSNDVGIAPD
jgi:hypothetical protein